MSILGLRVLLPSTTIILFTIPPRRFLRYSTKPLPLMSLHDAQFAQAALHLAEKYNTIPHGTPTDKTGKSLGATHVAELLLALPPQSNVRRVMPLLETHYHNFSVEMVGDWYLIRHQLELERAGDEKENAPLPPLASYDSDDDLRFDLAAASVASSSVPLATFKTIPLSAPLSPNLDTTPIAPPQIVHTVSPSALEAAYTLLLLSSEPQDFSSMHLAIHPASPNAVYDAVTSEATVLSEQDGEEDSTLTAVDSIAQDGVLRQILRDFNRQSASPAIVSDSLFVNPYLSPKSADQSPRSVPPSSSPTHRTVIRSRFVEDLETESDTFFSSANLSVPSSGSVNGFRRVPSPDPRLLVHLDFGGTKSPTPASGACSRRRTRRGRDDEGVAASGSASARREHQDIACDGAATTSRNGRKRPREEEQGEEEDNRPRRQRLRLPDKFVSVMKRYIPKYLQYMLW